MLPKVGLLSAPCISLVPRTPYSSASSHTLFQLDATSSVADTTASEEWVFESRRVEIQSFDRIYFYSFTDYLTCIGRILETELQIVGPDMLLEEVTMLIS